MEVIVPLVWQHNKGKPRGELSDSNPDRNPERNRRIVRSDNPHRPMELDFRSQRFRRQCRVMQLRDLGAVAEEPADLEERDPALGQVAAEGVPEVEGRPL